MPAQPAAAADPSSAKATTNGSRAAVDAVCDNAGSRNRKARLEYDRILVPVTASPVSDRAVKTAAMLASEKHAEVTLVNVIEVPKELPLNALFPDEDHESRTVLNHATAILDSYGVRAHAHTIHATTAAAAILEAADNADAQIIVIGTERRERRQRVSISRNVEQVLKRATCRVMIVTASPS